MSFGITYLTAVLGKMAVLPRWQKRAIVFTSDLVLLITSIWIAYSLRIGEWIYWDESVRELALGAALVMVPSFLAAGVYQSIFRYAGTGMMAIMLRAFAFYTAAMTLIYLFWSIPGVPRTLGLLQPLVFFVLVAGSRVMFRFLMLDCLLLGRFGGEVGRVQFVDPGG